MATPFAPTYTNTSATTTAQAATTILENTGFTLDWPTDADENFPDWDLLAGAMSYQDTPPLTSHCANHYLSRRRHDYENGKRQLGKPAAL